MESTVSSTPSMKSLLGSVRGVPIGGAPEGGGLGLLRPLWGTVWRYQISVPLGCWSVLGYYIPVVSPGFHYGGGKQSFSFCCLGILPLLASWALYPSMVTPAHSNSWTTSAGPVSCQTQTEEGSGLFLASQTCILLGKIVSACFSPGFASLGHVAGVCQHHGLVPASISWIPVPGSSRWYCSAYASRWFLPQFSMDNWERQGIFHAPIYCAVQPLDWPRAGCPSNLRIFSTKTILCISLWLTSFCANAAEVSSLSPVLSLFFV